jgi:MFS family permease
MMSLCVGYIYDLFGRRATLGVSVASGAALVAFIPYVAPSMAALIGIRLGIAITFCALGS